MRELRHCNFDVVLRRTVWIGLAAMALVLGCGARAAAQGGKSGGGDEPVYTAYRGVHIGATMSEARKALGGAVDKSDAQDLYVFNEKEMATVYYGPDKKVSAISVDFVDGAANIPTALQVVGSAVESKPDGSATMTVHYAKAGYWVCYNRTGGDKPLISVTMQKQ
jgi:hypothetical protein